MLNGRKLSVNWVNELAVFWVLGDYRSPISTELLTRIVILILLYVVALEANILSPTNL